MKDSLPELHCLRALTQLVAAASEGFESRFVAPVLFPQGIVQHARELSRYTNDAQARDEHLTGLYTQMGTDE